MAKMIFVNLPVTDLPRAKAFYEAIGFTNNPNFTDDTAACMVLTDVIHVMLLTHDKFMHFSPRKIGDAKTTCQVLLCISADSRADVDTMIEKAKTAGGAIDVMPTDEYDFMYGRNFEDLDGHLWAPMWMDPAAAASGPPATSQS
ncbi:MAG: lactoylglutathione lyase [Tardiphaga sp.]|nr:lactoylglutathione lyase [Tardiphaga sp.]